MARLNVCKNKKLFLMLDGVRFLLTLITLMNNFSDVYLKRHYSKHMLRSGSYFTSESRKTHLHNIIFHNDTTRHDQLRMNRSTFAKLCDMLRTNGMLKDSSGMKEHNVLMKTLVDGTMEFLAKVGNAIASDNDRTDRVVDELQKIDGLTLEETMEVGKIIIDDPLKSRMFLVLTPEKRREMVFKMLQK